MLLRIGLKFLEPLSGQSQILGDHSDIDGSDILVKPFCVRVASFGIRQQKLDFKLGYPGPQRIEGVIAFSIGALQRRLD